MFSLFRHTLNRGNGVMTVKEKFLLLAKCRSAIVCADVVYSAPLPSLCRCPMTVGAVFVAQKQYRYFSSDSHNKKINNKMENKTEKIAVDKEELRKRLTPMQYQVTQEAATERPFTGCYNKHYEKGIYQCIVCHQDLFSSDTKYDSGCGWPAFNDVLDKGKITLHRDASIPERIRTEVRCARCNAHMGHVFEDGPKPTRKRYCINSAAIEFISAEQLNTGGGVVNAGIANTATPIAQQ